MRNYTKKSDREKKYSVEDLTVALKKIMCISGKSCIGDLVLSHHMNLIEMKKHWLDTTLVEQYVIINGIKTPFKTGCFHIWNAIIFQWKSLSVEMKPSGLKNKPQLIFNRDEIEFAKDPSKRKVVGRGSLSSSRITSTIRRDNFSVLLTLAANSARFLHFQRKKLKPM